ncbi:sigma-54 dependent transcriptional regulator [Desulforhopalus sp. IMCC35007]|uniref:sigma-54-dependent transcriptional regulator n=1 Tax=Desulforhopalus sp. IMCC35007 TaxID=2569543 RepID=UPI0010AE11FF|nr:sigma-54 dependent transcriptional regulator [Desulforhopalus sp. IMCC35007]TKB11315.1 sigma-54-dependent Fis family transcriptional regulator [Desulforhopalus sp. IMCC35007]
MIDTQQKKPQLLLVDDDIGHRTMLKLNLERLGYRITEACDGDEVLAALQKNLFDLILLDLKMKRMGGIETLEALEDAGNHIPTIVITAFSSIESVVKAMKKGAYDYITKPIDIDNLAHVLTRALDHSTLKTENAYLKERLAEDYSFGKIIGSSEVMRDLFSTLKLVAQSDATVLIQGESGTGKELVANALHENGLRKKGPFIKVNCSALHENLLESELFGHEAGAFTGASSRRKGRFELAHGGTLFLDEIGDMSLPTQAKILRVLQEGQFERVGGNETINVDVRVVAATHKDLQEMIKVETFRQDLYYRLAVVPIDLPPLRERQEDISDLANHFLDKKNKKNKKNIKGFHPETLNIFMRYNWVGNIRELENTVERAVVLCLGEQITPRDLPPRFLPENGRPAASDFSSRGWTLRDMEREMIRATLHDTDNNKSLAAKNLGIARQTLINKIKEYNLEG